MGYLVFRMGKNPLQIETSFPYRLPSMLCRDPLVPTAGEAAPGNEWIPNIWGRNALENIN